MKALLEPAVKPRVLLVADPELGAWWQARIPEVQWQLASDLPDSENAAATGRYYGEEAGLATGAGNDLRVATGYAERMVRDYGMDAGIGPAALESRRIGDGPLALELLRAVSAIIAGQQ